MKKILILFGLLFSLVWWRSTTTSTTISGAPPGGIPLEQVPILDENSWKTNFVRPDGPAKVGIQVGHWLNDQVPEELENLRGNTGASGGGLAEWQVNMAIAELIKQNLESAGVEVDLVPTTVPERYWADVFIAIHADGNLDQSVTGFKFAAPWRDMTGRAGGLVTLLEERYQVATKLDKDPNVSRNMRGYYAFAWWRYNHAIHPMTTAVIAETGFLTNPQDRKVIVDTPEIPAQAISEAILAHLKSQDIL